MNKKVISYLIILLVFLFLIYSSTSAFYFSEITPSIDSRFNVENVMDSSYVRATVITYWVDSTSCVDSTDLLTCDISAKTSWNLKNGVYNSDWIKLDDGYYYYKTSVNSNDIDSNDINESSFALIDPSLTYGDLSDDILTGLDLVPQYEVLYDFVESAGVKDAWNVSYDSGSPVLIS